MKILEARRRPAARFRQRQPQLQQPHVAQGSCVLAVNDAAARRHPLHLAGVNQPAFVRIVNGAVEQQRDRFKARVWMCATHLPLAHVEMVIHQCDERIGSRELLHRYHRRRRVSWPGKAGARAGTSSMRAIRRCVVIIPPLYFSGPQAAVLTWPAAADGCRCASCTTAPTTATTIAPVPERVPANE